MGDRWSHIFMSWIDKKTAPNPDQLIVRLPRGQEVLCKWTSSSGGYDYYNACQSGFHFTHLRQSQTNSVYELKLLTGEVYVYGSTGKLSAIREIRDGQWTPSKLTIAYNGTTGQIETVSDSEGRRRLLFGYTSSLLTRPTSRRAVEALRRLSLRSRLCRATARSCRCWMIW